MDNIINDESNTNKDSIKDIIIKTCSNLHDFHVVQTDYNSEKSEVYIKGYKLYPPSYVESTFLIEGDQKQIASKLEDLF